MATITTREVGVSNVGRPLTNAEIDNNFLGLNSDITTILNTINSGTTNVPKITGITITDSSYNNTTANAIDLSGGYIKITGTGFTSGCQVLVNNTLATSVTFISSTQVRAQLPAQSAGSYIIYLVLSDGSVAIRVNAVTYSSTPTWISTSPISTSTVVSIQLAATSDSTVTYALASGSTLPTGISLSSSGLLSGTVTGLSVDTVYSFTITATDIEQQVSPKTFSVTIVVGDPYISYVPLLLETTASSTRSTTVADSSTNNFAITRNGTPSTGWTSAYQSTGWWSGYFNGSTSYLTTPNPSAGTIDLTQQSVFTVEAWVYPTSYNTNQNTVVGTRMNAGGGWELRINPTGTLQFYKTGSSVSIVSTATVPLNQWTHIAVTQNSSTLTLYVNATSVSNSTGAGGTYSSATCGIGGDSATTDAFPGYISNLRISNIARTITVPTAPFTADANTVLLCLQSNRFIDNSSNARTLTLAGTPQTTSYYYPSAFTAPTASPGAAYFNGTADYLTYNQTFALATNDFTLEFWLNVPVNPVYPSNYWLWGYRNNTDNCPAMYLNSVSGGGNNLLFVGGVTAFLSNASSIPTNTWTHIAIVRSGLGANNLKMYVNGAQVAQSSTTQSFTYTGTQPVGANPSGNGSLYYSNVYISNFRIVNGTAVYTAAFTPPTTPVTAIANTALLLNFADSNYTSATNAVQNNTFIDTSNYAFPITRTGTPTQGSFTPYWPDGYWSNYFASNGDYISVPDSANVELGASDFQMSAWIYLTAYPANALGSYASAILSKGNFAGTRSYEFTVGGVSGTSLGVSLTNAGGTSTGIGGSFSFALNTWYAVRVTRVSNRVYAFVNGTLLNAGGTAYTDTVSNGTDALKVGRSNLDVNYVYQFFGYISNVSLAIGGTGYSTANYTPATTPTTATSDIKFLSCQSNRFKDTSASSATVSSAGTPSVQTFQPFSPTTPYSATTYGGSGYFSSGSYLSSAANTNFSLGTSNFTIEYWLYLTSTSGARTSCTFGNATTFDPLMGYFATGESIFRVYLSSNNSSWDISNGTTLSSTLSLNCWYHVAIVRNGSTISLYINGSSVGSITSGASIYQSANDIVIALGQTSNYFPGYISNFRFVNNTAVYTSAFTPPTTPVTTIPNTSLLLNFSNAAIYDASAQNNIITVGSAQANTSLYKWSSTSIKFNGSTDYLNTTIPSLSGSFTIEFWLYIPTSGNNYFFTIGDALNASGLEIYIGTAGTVFNLYSGGAVRITSSTLPSTGVWNYVAVTRDTSSVIKLYLNGTQVGSSYTSSATFANVLRVGAEYYNSILTYGSCSIQDFRITNGVVRTISVPTLAFPTR
jgi:hypothetical protein